MTRASRGISPIQRKARGNKMAKKSGMPTLAKKESMKARVTKRAAPSPDAMSLGAANAPMPPAAGLRPAGPPGAPGMKKGGSCAPKKMACGGGAMKGYYKGGSVDGCVTKGKTKGKMV